MMNFSFILFFFLDSSCRRNSSFLYDASYDHDREHMVPKDGGMGRLALGSPNQLRNITDLLDTLLLGYDQHLRPDMGGKSQLHDFL